MSHYLTLMMALLLYSMLIIGYFVIDYYEVFSKTVGPNFKPLIPDFCVNQPFERARREWCKEVEHLLEIHGMLKISLEVRDEVRQFCDGKIKF